MEANIVEYSGEAALEIEPTSDAEKLVLNFLFVNMEKDGVSFKKLPGGKYKLMTKRDDKLPEGNDPIADIIMG